MARDLHLLGTLWAYVLPGTAFGLGFGMFLMRAFFRGLPYELVEAARLDGANEWQVFSRVMLPLAAPGLATLGIFQFMFTWKNFLIPLVLVQKESLRPISLGITFFFGRYSVDIGLVAAGITIMSVPMIVIYIILQRHITSALTQGALK
jgi:ABC-type glycerol-3-phosphate transport system permease component